MDFAITITVDIGADNPDAAGARGDHLAELLEREVDVEQAHVTTIDQTTAKHADHRRRKEHEQGWDQACYLPSCRCRTTAARPTGRPATRLWRR